MRVPVQILDLSSGAFVDAELLDEVTMDHFIETQRDWRPMVVEATKLRSFLGLTSVTYLENHPTLAIVDSTLAST